MSSWSRPAAYEMEATSRQSRPRTQRQRCSLVSISEPHCGQTSGKTIGFSSPVRRWATGASMRGMMSPAL